MTAGLDRLQAIVAGPSSWSRLERLESVTSTNDAVVERVRAGAPAGLVVIADTQTAGRGRRGRAWEDRPGASLLLSVATGVPSRGATLVPLAAGLAVTDAVRCAGLTPTLKWPNDVLLDGRKCAGILAEHHDLRPDGPAFLVTGIGIDVDWRETGRDPDLPWTSLAEVVGGPVDRWDVATDLLRSLEAWLLDVPKDPARLVAAYRVRCATIGAAVRVDTGREVVEGSAVDVDDGGALVLDTVAGRRRVVAGDVEHVEMR